MARPTRGHGWGRRGLTQWTRKGPSTLKARRGRKHVENLIVEEAATYPEETDEGIQNLIEDWEEEIKQESEPDEEIDD